MRPYLRSLLLATRFEVHRNPLHATDQAIRAAADEARARRDCAPLAAPIFPDKKGPAPPNAARAVSHRMEVR